MNIQIVDKLLACSTLLLSGMWFFEPNKHTQRTFDDFKEDMKEVLDSASLRDHDGVYHTVNQFSFLMASTNTICYNVCNWFRELGFTEIHATWNRKNDTECILFIIPVHELLPKIDSELKPLTKPVPKDINKDYI